VDQIGNCAKHGGNYLESLISGLQTTKSRYKAHRREADKIIAIT